MKINIKNLLFQPLAFHLAAGGEGLHLSARECREILAERVSEEIQLAAARGLVSLMDRAGDEIADVLGCESAGKETETVAAVSGPLVSRKKGRAK
ncbi:MAG: hypothetical protein QHI38_07180 [Armatimonadota bacterium]|nr:hypothetical protein [Armatimonadota bacterium]